MSADAWLTLAVVLVTVGVLVSELAPAPFVFVTAVTVLLVAGVIDPRQALSGFGNPAPATVAALYVVGAAVEATGVLQRVMAWVLGGASTEEGRRRRMLGATGAASSVLSNTATTAVIAPAIVGWGRRTGHRVGPYLLPVCFAITLGGFLTLVGATTNVVVAGLMGSHGLKPLGFFEITKVGAPLAAVGLLYLAFFTRRMLPERGAPSDAAGTNLREFTIEMAVGRQLDGQTVAAAHLRNLQGVFLVALERDGRQLSPGPDDVLRTDDRLLFAGDIERVLDLQRLPGLESADERHFVEAGGGANRRLYEAVVSATSPLVGSTMKEAGFRTRYGAAVLALHRAGERIPEKLGQIRIVPGDVMLILADHGWRERWRRRGEFLAIAPLDEELPPRNRSTPIAALVLVALVVLVATGTLDLLAASLAAVLLLIAARVLAPVEARLAVDIGVIVIIGASFGLSAAITASGLGHHLAHLIVSALSGLGDVGPLAGVLVASAVVTQFVTNNAAAVVMFPIAMSAAHQSALDPRPFALAVAVGASLSFATPIGYQTNMMVHAIGGYRFSDFVRLGLPLTVITAAIGVVLIPLLWPLH